MGRTGKGHGTYPQKTLLRAGVGERKAPGKFAFSTSKMQKNYPAGREKKNNSWERVKKP